MLPALWTRSNWFLCCSLLLGMLLSVAGCGPKSSPPTPSPPGSILFGLDAASWKVMIPLIREGYLPVMERLCLDGAAGPLQTLDPTVSVVIWTTIATGKLPENHGIFNWTRRGQDGEAGQLAITSNMRTCKALWTIAGEHNLSPLFVNWWASWPAESIDGTILSNRALSNNLQLRSWPEELIEHISAKFPPADQKYAPPRAKPSTKLADFITQRLTEEQWFLRVGSELYSERRPGLFGIYFRSLDLLEHELWDTIEPEKYDPSKHPQYSTVIADYYRYFDHALGELLSKAAPDTSVVVVSDHGMEPLTEFPPPIEALKLDKLLSIYDLARVDDKGKLLIAQSIAYDNGRYPPGLLRAITVNCPNPEARTATVAAVKERLGGIRTEQNHPFFTRISEGNLPGDDLVLELNPVIKPKDTFKIDKQSYTVKDYISFIIHPRAGQHWHAPPGVILVGGPGVARATKLLQAHVTDVTPTLLYMLGVPTAQDMDGNPLTAAFTDQVLKRQPIQWVTTYETSSAVSPREPITTSEDEEIKAELRALGYIE